MFRDKIELKDMDKMDAEYRELLGRVVTIQADCEIGGPHLYVKDILPSAPTKVDQLMVARTAAEEMDHFRKIARVAGDMGVDVSFVLAWPNQKRYLDAFRGIIKTWEDFVIFGFLIDRVGRYQLEEFLGCTYKPLERILPQSGDAPADLLAFYHPETLRDIARLRTCFLERPGDAVDAWIRMVCLNRLTGHSSGFFSVYTLPPNQATSAVRQRKINEARRQVPPRRDVFEIVLRKTKALLKAALPADYGGAMARILTGPAERTPDIADASVDLLVTSPPFLDVVDYPTDNWLRCWFAGIEPATVPITLHRSLADWEQFVARCFSEFARVVRPGGKIAFEVGEVRGGKLALEHTVLSAAAGLPLQPLAVMINRQVFTKTAQCWGVDNNAKGTNSNRIVVFERR